MALDVPTADLDGQPDPSTPEPVLVLTGRALLVAAAGVFAVGLAARAVVVEAGGGLRGLGSYDDGVYFSASLALLHGRLPYRDFLFLQPPGILVVLAPFAALAPVLGDAGAYVAARLGFLTLGALSATLVVVALRRFGALTAVAGGLVYALSLPSAHVERSTLLEPVGSFGTLVALAVLLRPGSGDRPPGRRERVLLVVAGIALGLGVVTKLFFALAALVVVVAAGRRAVLLLAGCVVVGAAVGSVALAAPAAAWRQVVLDQLGRPRVTASPVHRLTSILQVPRVPDVPPALVLGVALLALLVCCGLAVRLRGGRAPVVLLLVSFPVLLGAPSYYRHYAALTATPLALVVGIGVGEALRRLGPGIRRPLVPGAAFLGLASLCLSGWWHAGVSALIAPPLPDPLVQAVRTVPGCVTSDDPAVLLLSGTLTRTLEQGCPFWPDTTGWLYDADAPPPDDPRLRPERNPAWQRHAYAYLTSGDATVLVRRKDGLSTETRARIGVTASWDRGRYVWRVRPG